MNANRIHHSGPVTHKKKEKKTKIIRTINKTNWPNWLPTLCMVVCVCMNCKQDRTQIMYIYRLVCVCTEKQATSKIKQQSHKKIGHTNRTHNKEKQTRKKQPPRTSKKNQGCKRQHKEIIYVYIYIYIYTTKRKKAKVTRENR